MSEDIEFDPFADDNGVSTSGTTADDAHSSGGGMISLAGRYHLVIQSVEIKPAEVYGTVDAEGKPEGDAKRQLPQVALKLQAVAGEEESEIGKTMYHRIFLAKWANKKAGEMEKISEKAFAGVLTFLHSFGTVGDEVFDAEKVVLKTEWFERLDAASAIGKVEMEKGFDDKMRPKIAWNNNVWPLSHEDVKDVPKEPTIAAAAGVSAGESADVSDDLFDV